jgi:hypothetical protein
VQASLLGRAPLTANGNEYQAYYDDVLNITWLADATVARTNQFGPSGIDSGGYMTWAIAQNWIAAMNSASYLDVSDWRLPTASDTAGVGRDSAHSSF